MFSIRTAAQQGVYKRRNIIKNFKTFTPQFTTHIANERGMKNSCEKTTQFREREEILHKYDLAHMARHVL